jgi:hypothetical protein
MQPSAAVLAARRKPALRLPAKQGKVGYYGMQPSVAALAARRKPMLRPPAKQGKVCY